MVTLRDTRVALTRDLDRDTNTKGHREEVRPEVMAAWQELRERGYRVRLRNVQRIIERHQLRVDRGDFLERVLTYVDPTGETATWNVMREQCRGGGHVA